MSKLKLWNTTASNNNSAPPNGAPEGMPASAVNDVIRKNMASVAEWYKNPGWVEYDTATYLAPTQFTVVGDRTADYTQGRRVKATLSGGVIYGTIVTSAYDTVTTITVKWDGSGAMDATLLLLEVSILTTDHQVEASDVLIYNTQTSDYTLQASDNGKVVVLDSESDITVTLPQESTEALPEGFHVALLKADLGEVFIDTEGSDVLISPGGQTIAEIGGQAFITLYTSGTPNKWFAEGRLTD